jgi:hypothetical protein
VTLSGSGGACRLQHRGLSIFFQFGSEHLIQRAGHLVKWIGPRENGGMFNFSLPVLRENSVRTDFVGFVGFWTRMVKKLSRTSNSRIHGG